MAGPSGELRLVLEEVAEGPRDRKTSQFSLIFTARESEELPEGTYPVKHSAFQDLSLFLTPAGLASGGKTRFRADFNLLRE